MVVDRLPDANRFASIAEPALREGRSRACPDELDQLPPRRTGSPPRWSTGRPRWSRWPAPCRPSTGRGPPTQREALAGARAGGTGTIWPWQSAPLTLAVPVTSGGEVIGAVVTLSPTNRLRSAIVRAWIVAGAAGLLALGVFVLVAGWLARWILRPVTELDDSALRLAAGDFDSRVPANVGPEELRHLARSFNEMADHVGGSLVRQRAFVAQASHQLRNPLAALRIRVDNLARFWQPPGHEEHRLLLEETERLALILDGLLTLARAEGDQHRWESVDAAVVADERVVAWAPLALEKGVSLTRTGAGEAPVRVVATAVDQSLDALVDNAVKFSGPGRIGDRRRLRRRRGGGGARRRRRSGTVRRGPRPGDGPVVAGSRRTEYRRGWSWVGDRGGPRRSVRRTAAAGRGGAARLAGDAAATAR